MTDLLSFQVAGPIGGSFEGWKRTSHAQSQLYDMTTVGNLQRPSLGPAQVTSAFDVRAYHGYHNEEAALKRGGKIPPGPNIPPTTTQRASTSATDKHAPAPAPASRKRSRQDDDANSIEEEAEAPKRARGRPRVDTKDETAAERRRTQIRLAQRAYRSRKDTAITTLEQKVKELERSRHEMTKEVQGFYDFAISHGLADHCPQVARRFLDLTSKMIAINAKDNTTAEPNMDETQPKPAKMVLSHDDENAAISPSRPNRQQSSSSTVVSPRSSPPSSINSGSNNMQHHSIPASTMNMTAPATSVADYSSTFVPSTAMPLSSTTNYEIVTQATAENASFPLTAPLGSPLQSGFANDVTTPSPFLTLGVQASLAHMETTFGRRFQRTATEAGYRLVTSPNPPIVRLREVFGFVLRYETRETIARRMSTVLARSRSETLDYWNTPFTNLGGAGMNYMLNSTNFGDQSGYDMPIGNQGAQAHGRMMHRSGFSMGPFTQQVESVRSSLDKNLYILDEGYEGQFFDPDEIEGYLRDRGLTIPPSADVIDAEIDLNDFAVSDRSPSPQDHGNYRQDWAYLNQNQSDGRRYADGSITVMQSTISPHGGPQRVMVRIDIGLLIAELISNVVCLARAPGVRPNDINKSIRRAAGLTAVAG